MGWTFEAGVPWDVEKKVRDMFTQENEICTQEVVKLEKYGRYYMMALKMTPKQGQVLRGWGGMEPEFDGTITSACVLETRIRQGEWGYRDYGEASCVAPYASAKLIGMLTPTNNVSALQWREACLENVAKRTERRKLSAELSEGKKIRLNRPVRFTDGEERRDFIVHRQARAHRSKLVFECMETGSMCSIRRPLKAEWTEIDETFPPHDRANFQLRRDWRVLTSWHEAKEKAAAQSNESTVKKIDEMLKSITDRGNYGELVDAGLARMKNGVLIPVPKAEKSELSTEADELSL